MRSLPSGDNDTNDFDNDDGDGDGGEDIADKTACRGRRGSSSSLGENGIDVKDDVAESVESDD